MINNISYSQEKESMISVDQGLIPHFYIISPIDSLQFRYETYQYFKGKYWLLNNTILQKQKNGNLIGDSILIRHVDSEFYQVFNKGNKKTKQLKYHKVKECDSMINKIKNKALIWEINSETYDSSRIFIGYNNQTYRKYKNRNIIEQNKIIQTCYYDFIQVATDYRKKLLTEISRIHKEKKNRYVWFKENKSKVSTSDIRTFNYSFDYCDIDKRTLILIIINHTDSFIKVCDEMNQDDFFSFKLGINYLPKGLDAGLAIQRLEKSEIKSSKKRKIIRKLKKNVG